MYPDGARSSPRGGSPGPTSPHGRAVLLRPFEFLVSFRKEAVAGRVQSWTPLSRGEPVIEYS